MKKAWGVLVLLSLLLGGVVTLFYTTTLAQWHHYDDCRQPANEVTIQINNPVACDGVEYGSPLKFIRTQSTIAVKKSDNPKPTISDVVVGSVAHINGVNLLADWLVWSLLSGIVLYYPYHLFATKRKNKTKSKEN